MCGAVQLTAYIFISFVPYKAYSKVDLFYLIYVRVAYMLDAMSTLVKIRKKKKEKSEAP